MGKGQWQSRIRHFSHDHPLEMTNLPSTPRHLCDGCRSTAEGWIYRCNLCDFDLHLACSLIPLHIAHPCDIHLLNLLGKPAYDSGRFKCDACRLISTGFTYHCTICKTDLHPFPCAYLPLQLKDERHPHKMTLFFKAPYPDNIFSCDVCNSPGKEVWHYHCSLCSFDMHVTCANTNSKACPSFDT